MSPTGRTGFSVSELMQESQSASQNCNSGIICILPLMASPVVLMLLWRGLGNQMSSPADFFWVVYPGSFTAPYLCLLSSVFKGRGVAQAGSLEWCNQAPETELVIFSWSVRPQVSFLEMNKSSLATTPLIVSSRAAKINPWPVDWQTLCSYLVFMFFSHMRVKRESEI